MSRHVHDLVGVVGLAALTTGVFGRFGWEWACIIAGAIILTLAVVGAIKQ